MSSPLQGCHLTSPAGQCPAVPESVAYALSYQAQALGVHVPPLQDLRSELLFATPWSAPLRCRIDAWPSGQAPASEHTVQAACGLMSVHGRTHRAPLALGLDYVSSLTAVLALQGMAAAALATRRGLPAKAVRVSLGAAALLAVGQYLNG